MAGSLRLDTLVDPNGNVAMDIVKIAATTSRYTRNIYTQIDTTSITATTTWTLGSTFAEVTGFKAGSLIKLFYHCPCRNDSTSWGGMYIEPQVRYNASTWVSLGSSGYDGGVMHNASADIASYNNTILIDPAQSTDFSVQFRFYYKSYDGSSVLNGSHDINVLSGTATLASGNNGLQHYHHIIVEELALMRGSS